MLKVSVYRSETLARSLSTLNNKRCFWDASCKETRRCIFAILWPLMDDGGSAGWFRASSKHLFTLWGAWAPAAEPPGVARGLIFTSVRSFLNATLVLQEECSGTHPPTARALWHYLTAIVTATVGGKCVETAWKQEITGEWAEEPEEEVRSENTGAPWPPRTPISAATSIHLEQESGDNIDITCTQNTNWFPWNRNSLTQNTNLWP